MSREEPAKECEDWDNMDDLIMNTTKPAVPREAPEDPLAAEVEAFKAWSDFSYGMDLKGNFNPLIFWASPIIQMLFPMHAEMARSHFSGLHHEATSERTFSYTGRVISDLRRRMSADAVCANVIGAATHFEILMMKCLLPVSIRADVKLLQMSRHGRGCLLCMILC